MTQPTYDQIFERDKVCYEQNCEQFRAMNQLMWQVPLVAITVTGGLWFAAIDVTNAASYKGALFMLAAVLDLSLVFVLIRVRYVMGQYLRMIEAFNPGSFVSAPGNSLFTQSHVVIFAFSVALLIAASGSVLGIFKPDWLQF